MNGLRERNREGDGKDEERERKGGGGGVLGGCGGSEGKRVKHKPTGRRQRRRTETDTCFIDVAKQGS